MAYNRKTEIKPINMTMDIQCMSTVALDEIICGYVAAESNGYISEDEMNRVIKPLQEQLSMLIGEMS